MRDVVIAGAGMTRFGKFPDRGLTDLTTEAVRDALDDAGARPREVQFVFFGNVLAGLMTGQESTRGQHAVRGTGLDGIPLVNVENACATGSSAFQQAWLAVGSGYVDVAVAIGAEKLYSEDNSRAILALRSALDQERLDDILTSLGGPSDHSVFMDIYAGFAERYAEQFGATQRDFALVSAKNHDHGALNPKAQYRTRFSVDDILNARTIAGPLTLPMCAPIGDGAAAVVVTTPAMAARWDAEPVTVLATSLESGAAGEMGAVVPRAAMRAYEQAGVGPEDLDVIECHDAVAPAELIVMEELGLCGPGDAPALVRVGETTIGGRIPINPSGGLESKGHPLGATGIGQIVELADQLRRRAGDRQVEGARIGLSENAGGYLGPDIAVAGVTVLAR